MSERIVGYDLARALAVFGMVTVNFKVVMTTPDAGPAWLARTVELLEDRAAATNLCGLRPPSCLRSCDQRPEIRLL